MVVEFAGGAQIAHIISRNLLEFFILKEFAHISPLTPSSLGLFMPSARHHKCKTAFAHGGAIKRQLVK